MPDLWVACCELIDELVELRLPRTPVVDVGDSQPLLLAHVRQQIRAGMITTALLTSRRLALYY